MVVFRIDEQNSDAGAVVDGGELVVLVVGGPWDWGDELHVGLHLAARLELPIALSALYVSLVSLVGLQPAHA